MPSCDIDWIPAETCTALLSLRTSALSSRELASPPSTSPNTSSATESGSFSPGTAQLRRIIVAATRSCIFTVLDWGSVGTATLGSTLFGPAAIAPKYFSTSGRASLASTSPAITSTALFGP
jgi:hypothetical protein